MGCDVARTGLEASMELARGAMEDCRRGEEPSAVFFGDRERGGGRCVRLLRRMWAEVVRSGMEPMIEHCQTRRQL